MKPLRVALADDEPLARARLSRLLREAGCEVVAELEDGTAVLAWLQAAPSVDALFLDIHMPGATGLEVMAELPERLPVVFVTAFAEHAVRAFEAAAADYILKPLSADRLSKCLARLRERPSTAPQAPHAGAGGRYPVKAGEGHLFLELRRTTHFEVEDEVVWAWSGGSRFRTGWTTLAEVEQAFPSAGVLRIQRHLLLRPEAVLGLRPLEGGRASVRVGEGLELEASRTATPKLKELLGL
ncbi:MAG TPA: LytTR family DNA-binding domain-containing protein [Holophagaceae bacterium]|nr:LytTR family DNA-binding domain-containing protein [Holophagaceae bacterium]